MRKLIVATLALTPFVLHAQANTPAQTSNTLAMQSRFGQTSEFVAPSGSERPVITRETPLRISTGVTAPKLIHTVDIMPNADSPTRLAGGERTAVVELLVDDTGKPTDLKVLQSAGQLSDKNILEAVSQYRFKPGKLNGQPTAVPVKLEMLIQTPSQF